MTNPCVDIAALKARVGELELQRLVDHFGEPVPHSTRRLLTLQEGFGQYRTIYSDPGCSYTDQTCRGAAAGHYRVLTLEELCNLPVGRLAHVDGAFLWLWISWPKLRDGWAHELLRAWGFAWKSELVWDKVKMGQGRWLRKQTEVLGMKGKLRRPRGWALIRDLVTWPRSTVHSEKPTIIRKLVAAVSPCPMVELFARKASPFCDRWGDEAPGESSVREATP